MNAVICPAPLRGEAAAIAAKSDVHRKLICAALSDQPSTLLFSNISQDIDATLRCLTALGAEYTRQNGTLSLRPGRGTEAPLLDCGESGSTLRFLLPVAAALRDRVRFTGGGRLPERPIGHLVEAMEDHGVTFSAKTLPLETQGNLQAGVYALPGDVSSQYITGLMLALPLLAGDSRIRLTRPLQSAGYVDLTLAALRDFGIRVEPLASGWRVPGGQRYCSPGTVPVEGDWSNAAFFLCAGALSGPVSVNGLDQNAVQGDKAVLALLEQMGAEVSASGQTVTVSPGPLRGITLDVRDIPDLTPVLAVVAASAQGECLFTGAARLRAKESDRLAATAKLLRDLGGHVVELPDGLLVQGGGLVGGQVDGSGDHRIVMAAAVAAVACREPVSIRGAEAVAKSYPSFFQVYRALGGQCLEKG